IKLKRKRKSSVQHGFCKKAGAVLLGHNVIFITFVLLGEVKCFFCPLLRKAPPLSAILSKQGLTKGNIKLEFYGIKLKCGHPKKILKKYLE
ncbi:hypothetical protein PG286_10715, partial [Riemerella anatipestifer]|nr:hypothetical protein [Riemerella anatipestifer]